MVQFSDFGLPSTILQALTEERYTTPTPIQAQAIVPALQGRDLLGCAQTGTGKTAAFALPILARLLAETPDPARRRPGAPRALVLAPTRELATQIGESFATYGRRSGLRGTTIFGGVSQFHQVRALERGVDVLVATPGRLIDLLDQGRVDLRSIRFLVLDEADRMLDMGFIQPIRRIVAALSKPPARQTLLFSATMPPEIMRLADALLHRPVKVAVAPVASAAPRIRQSVYLVPRAMKPALLRHLLADAGVQRALVFTRTKHGADRLRRHLNQAGIAADAIHGNKAQNQRQRALDAFRSGRSRVLVATDVAARGLDVDCVTHVFNFDMPVEPEAYVHRIGRTGRAGASGDAVSFCDREEQGLLRAVERLIGSRVPTIAPLPDLTATPAAADPPRRPPAVSRPHDPPRSGAAPRSGARPYAPSPARSPSPAPERFRPAWGARQRVRRRPAGCA